MFLSFFLFFLSIYLSFFSFYLSIYLSFFLSFFRSFFFYLSFFLSNAVNFISRILKVDLNLYAVLRKQITSMTLSTRFQIQLVCLGRAPVKENYTKKHFLMDKKTMICLFIGMTLGPHFPVVTFCTNTLLKPYKPSVLVHSYSLAKQMSNCRGVWCSVFILFYFELIFLKANRVDSDQMLRSDLGLYCLHMPLRGC